jgi:hypothetical protein
VQRYPHGTFSDEAARKISAARWERRQVWVPSKRESMGYISGQLAQLPNEAEARADALRRIPEDAQRLGCKPVDEFERLRGVEVLDSAFTCRRGSDGHACAVDYQVRCDVETLPMAEICT